MSDERKTIESLVTRPVEKADTSFVAHWLADPLVEPCFPMAEAKEIEESAQRWVDLCINETCGFTAQFQGSPVGFGVLFLQTYKRLVHQCVHILVVDPPFRHMGIGSALLQALITRARERGVELLHVEVYEDPEVLKFYKKRGFKQFAKQEKWTKDHGIYRSRTMLERFI
jgi:GNAT superfamily N-acetyltransferase